MVFKKFDKTWQIHLIGLEKNCLYKKNAPENQFKYCKYCPLIEMV